MLLHLSPETFFGLHCLFPAYTHVLQLLLLLLLSPLYCLSNCYHTHRLLPPEVPSSSLLLLFLSSVLHYNMELKLLYCPFSPPLNLSLFQENLSGHKIVNHYHRCSYYFCSGIKQIISYIFLKEFAIPINRSYCDPDHKTINHKSDH